MPRLASLLLALAAAAPLQGPVAAAPAPPPTLLQRLRQLVGYNPSQAIGGSRSSAVAAVCLVSPPLQRQPNGTVQAVVASAVPVLVPAEPLNEVRIERGGRIAWQQRAASSDPIRGPIAWPLQPLAPGEGVLLRLRPLGAAGSDFADIHLKAAPGIQQQQLVASAQRGERLAQIKRLLAQGQGALASELVFAPLPATQSLPPELAQLRLDLIAQGCGTGRS